MKIIDWGYANEQEFVKEAMVSPKKRADFKHFNVYLVEQAALKYIQSHGLSGQEFDDLVKVGLGVFDSAFNNYIKLPNAFESDNFRFSTYYITWIRKAIEEYLDKDLNNHQP